MTSHQDKIKELTESLETLDYKVDRLENRIKGMPDELRENALEKYQQIKDFQQFLRQKEQALKEETEHAVHDLEASVEDAWDTLKLLFEDVDMEVKIEGL